MTTPKKSKKLTLTDPQKILSLRVRLGMNQAQFWGRIGVTQSGGSRYESGRKIPAPTALLLNLTYDKEPAALELLARLRPKLD